MVENKYVTTIEMSQKIGINTRSIEKNIQKLKNNGRLERIGSDKDGYWKVINLLIENRAEKRTEKGAEKRTEKMLELIAENSYITAVEMSQKIGINTRSIEKNIQKLKNSGQLERIGSDKGGYWKVISSIS